MWNDSNHDVPFYKNIYYAVFVKYSSESQIGKYICDYMKAKETV